MVQGEPKLHAWHIEEREYSRHEQRRGRRHAFERIEPSRTALVMVDMVPFFVEQGEFCRGIVPNINRLASALRDAGGTVAWVLPGPSTTTTLDEELLGPEIAEMYRRSGVEGPLRERLWHELEVSDDDVLGEKTAASAFFPGPHGGRRQRCTPRRGPQRLPLHRLSLLRRCPADRRGDRPDPNGRR